MHSTSAMYLPLNSMLTVHFKEPDEAGNWGVKLLREDFSLFYSICKAKRTSNMWRLWQQYGAMYPATNTLGFVIFGTRQRELYFVPWPLIPRILEPRDFCQAQF